MVPELHRTIGAEGRALLDRFNLLKPLVEQMVTREAIAHVVVSEEQMNQANDRSVDRQSSKWPTNRIQK